MATYAGGRGFVTYPRLEAVDAATVCGWVAAPVDHYAADDEITRVEWKSREHDDAAGLHEALLEHGFVAQEPEAVMISETRLLAVDVALPDGVSVRRVTGEADVRAMCRMLDEAFGAPGPERRVEELLDRLSLRDGRELWVAEADRTMVAAGRLEPVAGTELAGIWGGATLPQWRGRGLYRALTAARARSALAQGKTLLHSDSTAFSRPILQRAGLVRVSTTTPYDWHRSEN